MNTNGSKRAFIRVHWRFHVRSCRGREHLQLRGAQAQQTAVDRFVVRPHGAARPLDPRGRSRHLPERPLHGQFPVNGILHLSKDPPVPPVLFLEGFRGTAHLSGHHGRGATFLAGRGLLDLLDHLLHRVLGAPFFQDPLERLLAFQAGPLHERGKARIPGELGPADDLHERGEGLFVVGRMKV